MAFKILRMRNLFCIGWIVFTLSSCAQTTKVDLLIYNAKIYTVDKSFSVAEAIAVKDGKILDVGYNSDLTGKYFSDNKIDAKGKIIYPGFIDAHAHFYRYGLGLQTANLVDTKSWDEILDRVRKFDAAHPSTGGWLLGRGWDQNDWDVKEFPTKKNSTSFFLAGPLCSRASTDTLRLLTRQRSTSREFMQGKKYKVEQSKPGMVNSLVY